jgi:predicted kinase
MQAVLFIGLQGSGKTMFYLQHFVATHQHISLDLLRTRFREMTAVAQCVGSGVPFVVDNTNATIAERAKFIGPAKAAGFQVIGYYFDVPIAECLIRNRNRIGKARVPNVALFGTRKRLQLPEPGEGFDRLFTVKLTADRRLDVVPYRESPKPAENDDAKKQSRHF